MVIAGAVHNEERAHMQFMSAQLSNLSNQVWEMMSQVLNGIVFVLLGLELVRVVETLLIQLAMDGYQWSEWEF
ncbi:NhaP-type Na+/H+ and K+/H+ antiporters [Weissella viridescens]|uniref:NhaP-type Na+/H+ and K+/H+ antiporters n=1 Tax=Weissella viridescens TaxID=1629 RepID=A0A380P9Y4_WEIVI|nr:NhaP-type Na+/H+ and K+/H+ antiporters [Weissella viridescens]